MVSQYEYSSKVIVPAIRSSISKILAKSYGMKQEEIASKLGVAQAAVSKYLSGKYSKEVKEIEAKIKKGLLVEHIARVNEGKEDMGQAICTFCKEFRNAPCYIEGKLPTAEAGGLPSEI